MTVSELVAELKELSKLKNNWYSVAGAIEKFKEQHTGYGHISRRIRDACDASDFNPNTINRMLSVKVFYDSVVDRVVELKGIDPNSLSFPSMEIVKRLHQVNPEEGISMLLDVVKGGVPFRTLRLRYNELVSGNASKASVQQVSKREVIEFEGAALDRVGLESKVLFGPDVTVEFSKKTNQHLPFQVDVLATSSTADRSNIKQYGVEFFHFRDDHSFKRRIEAFLQRLLFNSQFLEAIWVVFPSDMGMDRINAFNQILDLLDCQSIGVTMLPWRKGKYKKACFKIIREPRPSAMKEQTSKLNTYSDLRKQLLSAKND